MILKNLKMRKERLEKERIKEVKNEKSFKCKICDRKIKIGNNKKQFNLCCVCMRSFYWKKEYEKLKEETERRFKLYDITIKSLMENLRKYEPIKEGLDN